MRSRALTGLAPTLALELRTQYAAGFRAAPRGGELRRVEIKVGRPEKKGKAPAARLEVCAPAAP